MQLEPLIQRFFTLKREICTQIQIIHVDQLERKWITISILLIGFFVMLDVFIQGDYHII